MVLSHGGGDYRVSCTGDEGLRRLFIELRRHDLNAVFLEGILDDTKPRRAWDRHQVADQQDGAGKAPGGE